MNAVVELVSQLEAIGSRPEPWAAVAISHARRLRRLSIGSHRVREDALCRLEGAEEVLYWASMLDANTHKRLEHLLIEAWSIHQRGEWPATLQGEVS
ncbi:hypothetical protein [Billgrantia desiderata]|uniref:hypothetical protein n=1 Tax=Billgrantia desiderata TaxID=52021 RepID=UPI003F3EF450